MPQLLFVDACVRGAESRSRMLAERFLSSYAAANPDAAILRRNLMRDRLEPQYPEVLARRDALAAAGSSTIRCSPTHGSLPARTASCSLRRSGNYPSPPF